MKYGVSASVESVPSKVCNNNQEIEEDGKKK